MIRCSRGQVGRHIVHCTVHHDERLRVHDLSVLFSVQQTEGTVAALRVRTMSRLVFGVGKDEPA